MSLPRLIARVEVTNGTGTFDSQNPNPARGDGLDSVRIKFKVRRTLDPTPNTAEVELYNLSRRTIDRITGTVRKRIEWSPEELEELRAAGASTDPIEVIYDNFGLGSVRLSWGYETTDPTSPSPPMSVGFIGSSNNMTTRQEGTDLVLTMKLEDGGQMLGAGNLIRTYKRGSNYVTILADLIKACGLKVDETKLGEALQAALFNRGIPTSKLTTLRTFPAYGPASAHVKAVMDSLNLRWSIQDGEFLLLDTRSVLAGYEPLILSTERGTLFEEPEPLDAQQMRAKTWATAEARPGREVQIVAQNLDTQYRIDSVEHSGDTYKGGETTVTLDAIQVIPGVF